MNFSINWDAHQRNICNGLSSMQLNGEFVDMTLAADGHHVQVHKMILSLVSPFIKDLITVTQCSHPVIFLNNMSYKTLQLILEYVYTGEVMVAKEWMNEFLNACKALHIKGLEDNVIHEYKKTIQNNSAMETNVQTNKTESIMETSTLDLDPLNHDDSDDDQPMDLLECKSETKLNSVESDPKKGISENASLQYTLSAQGQVQIILNRYIYVKRNQRRNGDQVWRCFNYQRRGTCGALLVTRGNQVIQRKFSHSHPFHDVQIMKRIRNNNIYTTLEYAEMNKRNKTKSNENEQKNEDKTTNIFSTITEHVKQTTPSLSDRDKLKISSLNQ